MKINVLKVGTDAELFVLKNKKAVPICGLVGGTKEHPIPVLNGNGFAVQEDNVMLEFNIPPANNSEEFCQSIDQMLLFLTNEMKKKDLTLCCQSSMVFDKCDLQSEQAKNFGCEPDFDVWRRTANKLSPTRLIELGYETLRSAGFHIHISYDQNEEEPTLETTEFFVKALDMFLGVPSVLIDKDNKRRKLYGRAGCFRLKEYGLEYRVLGSGMLDHRIFPWIYSNVKAAANFLNSLSVDEKELDYFFNIRREMICHIINTIDAQRAEVFCIENGITRPPKPTQSLSR